MRAQTVIEWAAILLGSSVALLVAAYWVFAPILARLNGDRFAAESTKLAEAEAAAWKAFHETGEFPDVDTEILQQPGWENARITEKARRLHWDNPNTTTTSSIPKHRAEKEAVR